MLHLAFILEIPDAPTPVAWRNAGPAGLLGKTTTEHHFEVGEILAGDPVTVTAPIDGDGERELWLNSHDNPAAVLTLAYRFDDPDGFSVVWSTGHVVRGVVGVPEVGPASVTFEIDRYRRIRGIRVWSDAAQRKLYPDDSGFSQAQLAAEGALGATWPVRDR